ncbi:DUF7240 domain-containing protein [Mycolicibacterium thermoresistibile]|uniref:Uncharacterized protein n=2 Tax=Mycolicibacterium thermoresistibile TaxID=1797 RepID=G7CF50_MYCT3|nr:hypothetical protein [Mycolicibacterium thermoresistibile]EHI13129.1 hypothetical protein KEK_08107 [Mycolicibacterium thermoresistibile ATCC 19527]MCV7187059.1 hypothetical protein [Mycolicibacterium thermoresistibile]SNW20317.1 Uncharacterised protein [Mycolicibacterium thermoresistibile]
MAAYHWRTLRQRMRANGITDPMALPSMHAIIDETEALALEAAGAGTDDPDRARRERQELLDKLYAPAPEGAEDLNGEQYQPPPAGFEDPAEVEASFDAFSRALGAR